MNASQPVRRVTLAAESRRLRAGGRMTRRALVVGLAALCLLAVVRFVPAQPARWYYLAPYTGTGAFGDAFRPQGTGGVAVWHAIDLRADPTLPGCCALLAVPVRADHALQDALGGDLDALTPGARTALETKLGVTLQATTLRGAIAEMLMVHARTDGTRWRPLRPAGSGGVYEIWLGDRIFAQRTVAWFLNRLNDAFARLFFALPAYADYFDETFTGGDQAALAGDLTWEEFSGTDWTRTSNRAQLTGNVGVDHANAEHDTITVHQMVESTVAVWTFNTFTLVGEVIGRKANDTTLTFYEWMAHQGSDPVNQHQLAKMVAGAQTSLGSTVTDDVVAGERLRLTMDGTTITGAIDGASKSSVTDSAIDGTTVGGKRAGIRGVSDDAGNTVALDNYHIRDIYHLVFREGPLGRGLNRGMKTR